MIFKETKIAGVFLLEPERLGDDRGSSPACGITGIRRPRSRSARGAMQSFLQSAHGHAARDALPARAS